MYRVRNTEVRESRKWRTLVVIAGVLAVFPLLLGRLFYLQVLNAKELARLAERQQQRLILVQSRRGSIYDRRLKELAVSVRSYSLFSRPREVEDFKQVSAQLHRILGLAEPEIRKKLKEERGFVWLKRQMDPDEAQQVQSLGAVGLGLIPEDRRFYPRGQLAGPVLGFVGVDGHGLEGVEYQFDQLLRGKAKKELVQRDALGRLLADSVNEGPEASYDLVLNLDEVIQYIAERELRAKVAETGARGGSVLLMDPFTGEILAMAQMPPLNPNQFRGPGRVWRNRVITDSYEPGSTFKVIVMSAALEESLVTPQSRFFCENGEIAIGGRAVRDHEKFGWLSVAQILTQSSNVGAIKVAQKLNRDKLYEYIRRFGFGSRTGVDLPGEATGLVRPVKDWSEGSLGAVPIGQELSVTPLQLVRAVAAIANGGVLPLPHVVREMRREGEQKILSKLAAGQRVISEKTSRQMVEILKNAVREGTGKQAAVDGFEVAGKTGTAQKYDPQTGSYSRSQYVASFVGFVPADRPLFVGLVVIDEPQGGDYWGGSVAAPVFGKIAAQVLRYLRISPPLADEHRRDASSRGQVSLDEREWQGSRGG